jgi:hypothetical protein
LFEPSAQDVRELAEGLRVVMERHPDIQVLWKLKANKDETIVLLGKEIKEGKVRVETWLKTDPVAILQSGNVVCSVHHGGGNSFYEATG